jgi:hypothetical protein
MKLVHPRLARSIWLFDMRDLNPKGKDLTSDLIEWIKESYGFVTAPDPNNPTLVSPPNPVTTGAQAPIVPQGPGGLVFQKGHFQAHEEIFIEISSLTMYSDGVVVDTASSTDDADQFAKDLLESAARAFALAYDAETVRKRLYLSELIVRSDIALEVLNPHLNAFTERLSGAFSNGSTPKFKVGGISFWTEPNEAGNSKVFTLERQAGKSFMEQRYYSQAPLPTKQHLVLLEDLERAIAGSG